jgi:hypothetical protein
VRDEPAIRSLALSLDLDDDAVRSGLPAAVQPARDDGELVEVARAARAGALIEAHLGVAVAVAVRVAIGTWFLSRQQLRGVEKGHAVVSSLEEGGGPSCFFSATSTRALAAVFSISDGV